LILMLTFSALMAIMPAVKAADVKTYAFLAVEPNPAGVNQQVEVSFWLGHAPPTPSDVYHNFTVTITKPDGTTVIKGPFTSYAHGAQFFEYTPDTVGTYTFKFTYPGETFASIGDTYLSSESPITTFIVQNQPAPSIPENPIPNDYWTRPINAMNRNWATIAGDWLMLNYNSTYNGFGDAVSGFNLYSQAPRSPHILWTKTTTLGGIAGGESSTSTYYSGQSYDIRFAPPIVMDGRIYYRTHESGWSGPSSFTGVVCVDLRTGQELWKNDEINVDVGQEYNSLSINGEGVIPYLWDKTGTTWHVYDPFTGQLEFSFANATSGVNTWWPDAVVFGTDGTMYVYLLDGIHDWFAKWSSTQAISNNGIYALNPSPGTYDWRQGIEWNITIPEHHVQDPVQGLVGPAKQSVDGNVLVAKVSDWGNRVYFEIGYDMNTGKELWVNNNPVGTFFNAIGDGVYASFDLQTMRWTGYDVNTGKQLWVSDQNEYPWGAYLGYAPMIANGVLYSGSFDGYLHAFDIKTGKQLWKAYSAKSGTESSTGTYAMVDGPILASGVVFTGTSDEHEKQPLSRGNSVYAFDAASGNQLWNISGYMSLRAIADGYLLGYNGYDNLIYCFGKGPSATTVAVPQTAVQQGTGVLIQGTVTDQSAGQPSTPAISDKDMGRWMEYLKMQQPMPTSATGVPIALYATGPDGKEVQIGQVTSDISGHFSFMWTPSGQGVYKIAATFAGSDSYGSSYAETSAGVTEALNSQSSSSLELYIIVATIVILIAIAIAVIVLKRK
jgi:outer membrane protein assembly factor BamB